MSDTAFSVPTSLPKASGDDASTALGIKDEPGLRADLTSLAQKNAAESSGLASTMKADYKTDRARAEQAFNNEQLREVPTWDAAKESSKHQTDPIQEFASLGSVFGILASAFTHAPMTNALNASAAAINAIKAGDSEAYKQAHTAWKENTDLALKRAELERGRYQDAVTLMKTNMAAGMDMMKLHAIETGDKQVQILAEHGDIEAIDKLKQTRAETAEKLEKIKVLQQENMMNMGIINDFRDKEKADFKEANGREPVEMEKAPLKAAADKKYKEYQAELKRYKAPTPDQQIMADWQIEHPDASAEEQRDFAATLPGAKGKGSSRQQKPDEEAVRSRIAELRKEFPEMSLSAATQQAEREQKKNSQVITANKADELQGKVDRVKFAKEKLITPIENLLMKHNLIAGLGGSATRPFEIMANILGSNATDRKEFQRLVSEMQMIAPRILLDTSGRPLGAEANRINTEIAGLAPGDTGPNSIRAYFELRDQMDFIENNLAKRKDSGAGSEAPKASGDKWWESPAAGRVK